MKTALIVTGKPCKRGHSGERYASSGSCVSCAKAQARAAAQKNPDRKKEVLAAWRKRNPEKLRKWGAEFRRKNPERSRAYVAAWDKRNAAKVSAYRAKYRRENREKMRSLQATWKAANPDYFAVAAQRRRSQKLLAPGAGISPDQWREILDQSLGICAYCNRRGRLTLEHIDPVNAGGEHDVENATAICKSCNRSKNDTPLLLWMARLALRKMHQEKAA